MTVSSTRTALSGANWHNIEDNKPTIRVSTPSASQEQPTNMRRGLERLMSWLNEKELKTSRGDSLNLHRP